MKHTLYCLFIALGIFATKESFAMQQAEKQFREALPQSYFIQIAVFANITITENNGTIAYERLYCWPDTNPSFDSSKKVSASKNNEGGYQAHNICHENCSSISDPAAMYYALSQLYLLQQEQVH